MIKSIQLQYLISYLGALPFLIILFDKFFLNFINTNIVYDFIIIYSLIIFVFIGAINWNFGKNISIKLVLFGFMPSLISVLLIFLYLLSFKVVFIIILSLLIQLFVDNFFYINEYERRVYFRLRVPLTFIIVLSLIFIQ